MPPGSPRSGRAQSATSSTAIPISRPVRIGILQAAMGVFFAALVVLAIVAPHLALIEVNEPKTVKNRMHIDLAVSGVGPPEVTWSRIAAEAARLRALGATVRHEYASRWISMADPEGNEFDIC